MSFVFDRFSVLSRSAVVLGVVAIGIAGCSVVVEVMNCGVLENYIHIAHSMGFDFCTVVAVVVAS